MIFTHKVLIVGDQQSIKMLVSNILSDYDESLDIALVNDGRQALISIAHHLPDLVITDLDMPNMDGMELINYLMNISSRPKIIVLVDYKLPSKQKTSAFSNHVIERSGADYRVSKSDIRTGLIPCVAKCFSHNYAGLSS